MVYENVTGTLLQLAAAKAHKDLILLTERDNMLVNMGREPIFIAKDYDDAEESGKWGIQVQWDVATWLNTCCTCEMPDEELDSWARCLSCGWWFHQACCAELNHMILENGAQGAGWDRDFRCNPCLTRGANGLLHQMVIDLTMDDD